MSLCELPNPSFAHLPDFIRIDVVGRDSQKIVQNLVTNDLRPLEVGQSITAFMLNARGWVLALVAVVRTEQGYSILSQHPDPVSVSNHIDRYIINEDAEVREVSVSNQGFWLSPGATASLSDGNDLLHFSWLSTAGCVLCSAEYAEQFVGELNKQSYAQLSAEQMLCHRIATRWPAPGTEIGEKTLAQELDLDASTISFSKGCYLGQETVARLDMRGQLQKKLCLLTLAQPASVDSAVERDGQPVGMITSATSNGPYLALAMIKRGSFECGQSLMVDGLAATVV